MLSLLESVQSFYNYLQTFFQTSTNIYSKSYSYFPVNLANTRGTGKQKLFSYLFIPNNYLQNIPATFTKYHPTSYQHQSNFFQIITMFYNNKFLWFTAILLAQYTEFYRQCRNAARNTFRNR